MWVGQATRSVVVSFSCKGNVTSQAAWELFRTWKREELPLQAPPLTGPIVFALIATALAWNLTDVAVLMAIGYGCFLRTMQALTLQPNHSTRQLHSPDIAISPKRVGAAVKLKV